MTETSVLGFAPAWTWRKAALDESGRRSIGYRFRVPVALGATEFDSLGTVDDVRFDSIDAFSVVPGVEIEIPLTSRWTIKPQAYIGTGKETGGGTSAKIFRISFRSQLVFMPGATTLALVNGVERIGFSPDSDASDAINLVQTGLDFSRPLADKRIGDVPVELHWHVMYTRYLDTLGFDVRSASLDPDAIGSEWEVGIAFGRRDSRLQLWRLKLDRFGITYRFESGGGFSGVGIVFKSLFDR